VAVLPGSPQQAEGFASGVISGPDADFAPTFLPDSSMVLFTRRNAQETSEMIFTRHASVWTPSIAQDGALYFMNTNPVTGRFRLRTHWFVH